MEKMALFKAKEHTAKEIVMGAALMIRDLVDSDALTGQPDVGGEGCFDRLLSGAGKIQYVRDAGRPSAWFSFNAGDAWRVPLIGETGGVELLSERKRRVEVARFFERLYPEKRVYDEDVIFAPPSFEFRDFLKECTNTLETDRVVKVLFDIWAQRFAVIYAAPGKAPVELLALNIGTADPGKALRLIYGALGIEADLVAKRKAQKEKTLRYAGAVRDLVAGSVADAGIEEGSLDSVLCEISAVSWSYAERTASFAIGAALPSLLPGFGTEGAALLHEEEARLRELLKEYGLMAGDGDPLSAQALAFARDSAEIGGKVKIACQGSSVHVSFVSEKEGSEEEILRIPSGNAEEAEFDVIKAWHKVLLQAEKTGPCDPSFQLRA